MSVLGFVASGVRAQAWHHGELHRQPGVWARSPVRIVKLNMVSARCRYDLFAIAREFEQVQLHALPIFIELCLPLYPGIRVTTRQHN